jgi:hypothetical protein
MGKLGDLRCDRDLSRLCLAGMLAGQWLGWMVQGL